MITASIVVPTFKRVEQTLSTLDLLLAAKGGGSEFELEVIVADSSPDDELRQQIRTKFGERVVYTRPHLPGIAANKNQGAKIATSHLLIFCDSDIEIEPDTISQTLIALRQNPTTAGLGGQVIWKGGERNGELDRPRPEDRQLKIDNAIYVEAIYSRYFATYKPVFEAVGGYDEVAFNMRGEGSDLSTRYWRAGFPLVYAPEIKVHHVADVPDAIAVRVTHSEWGIAKDLLLLAYKYAMLEGDYPNFMATVKANFASLPDGYYQMLMGIGKHLDFITKIKPTLDAERFKPPTYDFKFLEVFTDQKLFTSCLSSARARLASIYTKAWK
ncbi:MAG: Glycosyl transferase, family 2 [Candidatus Gottesmanbacteria bacterium GW2011_GWB1_43_11]|uniref:Glycosyl transferase, family 2 n=1 Tax=Candidatus Gottesmanbacteria bacterium GW2011_GWB1_43_11 TaxID=1618446 RepID=A0A0G1EQE2_9BACT|nr:MAG: Glycosyl transferase, family 2 [Candidatus Gottesmanbacteria bacterium GW2011_GWA2_42_16]KKS54806.1 MAG: Glycosyl transferase, family 2 [Candidatus Gottesmanbacteria bacterium GW2011_GWA1_42_26]KKS80387.1 MAG: Glycosyl transferase family 2 [Candidatus Gottesmanbacteria bacterium GW2011_GWC1_43_10]KKS85251.1 MAG: Glycosyl transferase, family 2 [Candidatus Gottesmanbacteria bacterium GW2011_GWB1_43_11]OGG28018.1 MAG: hypothetical protein A3A59_04655 [Candidatus Gottesmanbacteria bacterium